LNRSNFAIVVSLAEGAQVPKVAALLGQDVCAYFVLMDGKKPCWFVPLGTTIRSIFTIT